MLEVLKRDEGSSEAAPAPPESVATVMSVYTRGKLQTSEGTEGEKRFLAIAVQPSFV